MVRAFFCSLITRLLNCYLAASGAVCLMLLLCQTFLQKAFRGRARICVDHSVSSRACAIACKGLESRIDESALPECKWPLRFDPQESTVSCLIARASIN